MILFEELLKEDDENRIPLDGLKSYFDACVKITSGKQQEYFTRIRDNAKPVTMGSSKSIPELSKIVKSENKRQKFKQKQCYSNAANMVWADSRIGYVEGFIYKYVPMDHAWNIWLPTGMHFDVTSEFLFNGDLSDEYYEIVRANNKELTAFLAKTGTFGGYMQYKLGNIKLKK